MDKLTLVPRKTLESKAKYRCGCYDMVEIRGDGGFPYALVLTDMFTGELWLRLVEGQTVTVTITDDDPAIVAATGAVI